MGTVKEYLDGLIRLAGGEHKLPDGTSAPRHRALANYLRTHTMRGVTKNGVPIWVRLPAYYEQGRYTGAKLRRLRAERGVGRPVHLQ